MTRQARLESECLSLLARLYSGLGDEAAFTSRRAECEAWLFRRRKSDQGMATFLCQQLRRAAEARQVSAEISGGRAGVCAAVMLTDGGRVVAASPEAWTLLHSGDPAHSPLQIPAALVAHLAPTLATGVPFPLGLRVALDDRSGDIAGVLLGVDEVPGPPGRTRKIATLLVWDPGVAENLLQTRRTASGHATSLALRGPGRSVI
jgi:hypothetical protein